MSRATGRPTVPARRAGSPPTRSRPAARRRAGPTARPGCARLRPLPDRRHASLHTPPQHCMLQLSAPFHADRSRRQTILHTERVPKAVTKRRNSRRKRRAARCRERAPEPERQGKGSGRARHCDPGSRGRNSGLLVGEPQAARRTAHERRIAASRLGRPEIGPPRDWAAWGSGRPGLAPHGPLPMHPPRID